MEPGRERSLAVEFIPYLRTTFIYELINLFVGPCEAYPAVTTERPDGLSGSAALR